MAAERNQSLAAAGFTLTELMIAVAIVGVLAVIAYPSYQDHLRKGRRSAAQSLMINIAAREQQYLIDARRYRVRSRWADVQPRAADQNAFLNAHGWEEYASWHLALTDGASEETKARYAFVFGDFRRLHRMALIACYYRAAEWEHTDVMVAAHNLLLYLDRSRASRTR